MPAHTKGSHVTSKNRVKPSAHLSKNAASIFTAIVSAVDPDHFSAVDLPLLEQYANAADQARQAQKRLDTEGCVIDGKASPWLVVQEKAGRHCVALSARLRICPQSRFDRLAAGANSRPQPGSRGKPWEKSNGFDPLDEFDPDGLIAR